MLDLCIKF